HATAAWRATDIVVAEDGNPIAGSLTVLEVWTGGLVVGDTLFLPEVSQLYLDATRKGPITGAFKIELPRTTPRRVVLFLLRLPPEEGEGTPTWIPAAEDGGMEVSAAWLMADGVHAFAQVFNPGPTVLTRYHGHSEVTLREQVKGVLAIRARLGYNSNEVVRAMRGLTTVLDELAFAMDVLDKFKTVYPEQWKELMSGGRVRPTPTIRARVTAVDHKLGLVVINAGQRQGVTKGMAFIVFRKEEDVGKIIVDEIYPDVSACRYDRPSMHGTPEVGDDATTRLEAEAARGEKARPIDIHMRRRKVTAVDHKLGLVVINAGQRQGVKKGMVFIVFRADKYVGKVIADEIHADVSSCRFDWPSMRHEVEVGDDVTTKLALDF
ncbi:hypothetical protein HQ560_02415, partial [bacterium]|nr:hypothetical protein [bacterium]